MSCFYLSFPGGDCSTRYQSQCFFLCYSFFLYDRYDPWGCLKNGGSLSHHRLQYSTGLMTWMMTGGTPICVFFLIPSLTGHDGPQIPFIWFTSPTKNITKYQPSITNHPSTSHQPSMVSPFWMIPPISFHDIPMGQQRSTVAPRLICAPRISTSPPGWSRLLRFCRRHRSWPGILRLRHGYLMANGQDGAKAPGKMRGTFSRNDGKVWWETMGHQIN